MPFFDKYPYTNFHNINLDWVLQRVKEWGELVEQNNTAFHDLKEANEDFKNYVTSYLEDLDVQAQIDDKLDRMFESGELTEYLQPYVSNTVTDWLEENITEPTGVIIDSSLTVAGACADSKAVGERLAPLDEGLRVFNNSKSPLLSLLANSYYSINNALYYYNELYNALYGGFNWDEGYIWLYRIINGLLSEQSYATQNLVGAGGTESLVNGSLRLHVNRPATESAGQNAYRYNFTPATIKKIECRFKMIHNTTAQIGSALVAGGFQFMITTGSEGLMVYLAQYNNNIAIEYYLGNTKQVAQTNISVDGEHTIKAWIENNSQNVEIDGNTIISGAVLSSFYTTFNRVGVTCTSPLYATNEGVTVDIIWLASYTE